MQHSFLGASLNANKRYFLCFHHCIRLVAGETILSTIMDLLLLSLFVLLSLVEVQWTRDSTTAITEGTQTLLNDPVTAQYTHTLTVTGRYAGLYTCTVQNNKPSMDSAQITVQGNSEVSI